MSKERQQVLILPKIHIQRCECCRKWFGYGKLLWDLKADRLVCKRCFEEVKKKAASRKIIFKDYDPERKCGCGWGFTRFYAFEGDEKEFSKI